MVGALVFLGICLSVVIGARVDRGQQLNRAMQKCDCVCRPIDGTYPWVVDDLRVAIHRGEQLKAYNRMMGPVVCVRPDEPAVDARFEALQQAVDDGERARLSR